MSTNTSFSSVLVFRTITSTLHRKGYAADVAFSTARELVQCILYVSLVELEFIYGTTDEIEIGEQIVGFYLLSKELA